MTQLLIFIDPFGTAAMPKNNIYRLFSKRTGTRPLLNSLGLFYLTTNILYISTHFCKLYLMLLSHLVSTWTLCPTFCPT